MYRLAVLLKVSWSEFQELELWQIRNRAFVAGEDIVQQKINELDVLMAYHLSSKSQKPILQQSEFEEMFRKPLKVEEELTEEEWEAKAVAHNLKVMKEFSHRG